MLKRFVFAREDQPGTDWLHRFAVGRAEAERWYRGADRADPPSADECRAMLRRYMPELLAPYDRACDLVGDDEAARCILSHYRPPPFLTGCSQGIWLGDNGPALIRNYDFPLDVATGRIESTRWFGREVIAKVQRPWGGCIDGMNEAGLVASLTFGGSTVQGAGFSIILMLRYVLETCNSVPEAIEALRGIPIAQSQNLMLLDRSGAFGTLFLGPGRAPAVSILPACTNHQENSDEKPDSVLRLNAVLGALHDPAMTLQRLISRFLEPPIYSRRAESPTVYTAIYRPVESRVDYIWPGHRVTQRIGRFEEQEYLHDYGTLVAA
jgi:predicted choloylglycine hydrolase